MATENGLVITISGDTSDLENSLKVVTQKIAQTGNQIGAQGAIGGKKFNQALFNEFDQIEQLSKGSFTGIARTFLTSVVNPITASAAVLGATLYAAFSLAEVDEENKKVAKNFDLIATNAGISSEALKNKIAEIAEGYVGLSQVLPVASEAIIKLGANANRTGELFELARNIGVRTGKDINDVFNDLTNGVTRQNKKLLENNLIKIDADKAIRDFAASNNIAVSSLSDAAKQQAVLNAVLEQGKKNFKDTGGEVAPVEGGIRKLKLAAEDLKDAFAAIVNSKLGEYLAALASGAASAIKSFVGQIQLLNGDLGSTDDQIKRLEGNAKALEMQISANKYSPENLKIFQAELDKTNEKIEALKTKQQEAAAGEAPAGEAAAETPRSTLIDPELERERLAKIKVIKDEARKVDFESELAQRQALLEIDSDASFQEKEAARLQIKQDAANNEYLLQLEKNKQIKDLEEKQAADVLALSKKNAADKKALGEQDVARAKAEADAKRQIEANFWAASFNFAEGNAEATKALSIAQAIRNTYQGATLALASYPPPFNVIAAASTVALGLSQVAKITGANQGALVTGGEVGKDTNPFLLSKGEIVAPAKSYDNVVDGEIRARGYVKGDENAETNALLSQILAKLETPSIVVNSDFLTDENSINRLADKLREAVQFRGAVLS